MPFFGNVSAIAATASLTIQIVVLFLIFYAISLKSKQKFRQHGLTMMSAVLLHAITIFVIMIPSFFSFLPTGTLDFSNTLVIVAIIHATIGLLAFVMGASLAASWRLRKDLRPCFARKQVMRITAIIWVTALLLGIFLYWSFYAATMII